MQIKIKHCVTGEVIYTHPGDTLISADLRNADLSGADLRNADLSDADLSGADLTGADLRAACLSDANLTGADLSDANLSDADLSGADLGFNCLIDGGQRSDGYRFIGWMKESILQIRAGCRDFTMAQAREHWAATRGGTPLGEETTVILDHMERVAKIRGLLK